MVAAAVDGAPTSQLKHDVVLLGHLANGLGYYRFSYLGSSKAYVGVIAQEVQNLMPEAVTRGSDGYLRVYYEKLGLKFRTYSDWLAGGAKIPALRRCRHDHAQCRFRRAASAGVGAIVALALSDLGVRRRSRPILRRRMRRRRWLPRSRPARASAILKVLGKARRGHRRIRR